MYRIKADNVLRLVTVDVSGFWSLATIGAFDRELDAAVRAMGDAGPHTVVLGFDDADIAPGPVVEALRQMIVGAPSRACRIGFHATSALKRIQVNRIAQARDRTMVFATRDEAVRWVCSTEEV